MSLLLIDVQGFELEVLKGMNWNNSPDFIVYEDDLKIYNNKSNLIRKILKKKGYVYLGGKYDKIFSKKLVICQISLANNIPVIKENYYNFNKLYNNLLFFIICPENQLKIFKKSLNEKNIRIISEDKIIKFSKFKRLFVKYSKNQSYKSKLNKRLNWYYQQIIKISFILIIKFVIKII